MPKSSENNRVLSRVYGREISAAEIDLVSGGIQTHNCTFDFNTCQMDMDCEQIPQCP